MYNLKFVKDTGETFNFDVGHRLLYDLEPLSELDVNLSTSQGVGQLGSTVEYRAIEGVERDITGHIIGAANDIKQRMLNIFTPFSEGQLYFNDKYYCDCVVKRTPAIGSATRDVGFSISLYCAYPYWLAAAESVETLNIWKGCFRFPGPTSAIGTNYDSHTFATRNIGAFVNVYNSGDVKTPFSIILSADEEQVTNYGLIDVYTLEYLMMDDVLYFGEQVEIYWSGSQLRVSKILEDGTVEDDFAALDEGSTLFYLQPGDNVLRTFADGDVTLNAIVTYRSAYSGVYDGM